MKLIRIGIAALVAAFFLSSATAMANDNSDDDETYTYGQFAGDCELAGGTPVFTTGTAACDFDEGEDIVCDAGGGTVSGCELGEVTRITPTLPGRPRAPQPSEIAPLTPDHGGGFQNGQPRYEGSGPAIQG